MADYIEGKRAAIEALRTHVPIQKLLLADNLQRDSQVKDILRKAQHRSIEVRTVPRRLLDEKSERGSHQGVIAYVGAFPYVSMSDIIQHAADHAREHNDSALVIVLDHITDAGNLGAIARSAEAVGASGIVIPNKRSARVSAATYKSSAGAINHIPVSQVANIASTIERLKSEGFWIAGASEKASHCVWDAPLGGKIALVMGNEQEGISRLVLQACDFLVALPQAGQVSSLNVAQASTAIMYEWLRQAQIHSSRD